ncbi:MAG TPA: PQQ-binding-like beta-propeller repeat protein [Candidatus Dormibacteraeota bacterium]|nr:PQQ-binding-like beta-propeller repeat protein [Candidatus Dormibacteraeota bacterium]
MRFIRFISRWGLANASCLAAATVFLTIPGAYPVSARQSRSASPDQGVAGEKPLDNRDAIYAAAMARRKAQLEKITPVSDTMLEHPPDGDWLAWRRTYSSLGYSPLRQINVSNVNNLRVAWSRSLPLGPNEITPLVHDGVIFIESANTIQALDGATGDLLWQYVRPLPEPLLGGRKSVMRGMALYQDKLYAPTADGHLIALNVKTGKLVWDYQAVIAQSGVYARSNRDFRLDGAPIVVHGKVIVGVSLGIANPGGGCFIVGLDAGTGKELWRFHNIAQPGEPGGDTWNGAPADQRFGASIWTGGSYDPRLNLVYFGTGNTYDTATLLQPRAGSGQPENGKAAPGYNDALYTDSTLALNPDTGKLVWYYQHMNRDVWDLDWAFEQSLITLPIDGKPADLVVTGGKLGLFDAVERGSGKYEFSKDLGLQNVVVAIDPKTGKKIINPALAPEANQTKLLCPNANGARNWPATSYDPGTHILYVPMVETCADFTWIPGDAAQTAAGGEDMHFTSRPRPGSDGKFGRIEAVNLETRKVVWIDRQRAPVASAMLSTAGGIVFNGARDRQFTAYDAATGKILWQVRLNASPSSAPVSYSAGGRQYIAVVAGGGGTLDAGGGSLTPEIDNPPGGTSLWTFELPDAGGSEKPRP